MSTRWLRGFRDATAVVSAGGGGGGGGSGDVEGPASSVDNRVARFNGITGKIIQNSAVTIDDSGNITTAGTVDGRDVSVDGSKLDGIEVGADVTDAANVAAAGAVMSGAAAGGSLGGTYPNPSLAAGAVGTTELADDVVTYAKLQNVSATDRLLGRDTAGAGNAEEITVGGGLEFTGSGGIRRSALTGDVTASAGSDSTTIANDAVSNAKLANVATATIKGRITAGIGDPEDLSASQATSLLNAFVGDSGSGGTKGLVPAPAAGDAAALRFLRADGSWATPAGGSGSGDVEGPASSTDNAVARFDLTTGKLLQNSVVTIDDSGNITTAGTVDGRDVSADGSKLDGIETGADVTDAVNVAAAGAVMSGAAAGGSLSGTYPSPTLAAGVVGTTQLADDAVTYAKLQNVSATDRLLGRDSSGAGNAEEITVGGGLEFTGSGGIRRSAFAGGDVVADAGSAALYISNNVVSNARLENVATATIKGRITAGSGSPEDLNASQATSLLNAFVGDSGGGGTKGLVPAPGVGDAAALKFLKADGTWDVPAGSGTGDVTGPASSTDNAVARFDLATGKIIQNSAVTIDDSGNITTAGTVDGRDVSVDGSKLDGIETGADVTDAVNVAAAGAVMSGAAAGGSLGGTYPNPTLAAGAVGTTELADDVVTYAKLQNLASDRLLGRDTASTGNAEEITVGGGLEFTGSGGIRRSALTGDVTASAGSDSTTIANAAVTLAKMADLAQDQFIGRTTASTGAPQTATITAAARTVLDDASVGDMVNTLGGATSTGTGGLVRATSPTLVTPTLGAAAATSLTLTNDLPVTEGGTGASDAATARTNLGAIGGSTGATDNRLLRADGTGGATVQNSAVLVGDDGEISGYRGLVTTISGTTYTLQSGDTGQILDFTNGSDIEVTLPNSLPKGWCATILQSGAGQVEFVPASGANLRNADSHTRTSGQWAGATLVVRANTDNTSAEYVLMGSTAA